MTEQPVTDIDVVELAPQDVDTFIDDFKNNRIPIVHSFKGDDEDTLDALLAAIQDSKNIRNHLGEEIEMANYVIQRIEVTDKATGELAAQPRVIIVDTSGQAYSAVSSVMARSIQTIVALKGEPSAWSKPTVIRVDQIDTRSGNRAYNLTVVPRKKK